MCGNIPGEDQVKVKGDFYQGFETSDIFNTLEKYIWIYEYTYMCMKEWWKDSYHFWAGLLRCLLASRRWKPQSRQTSCSDIKGHLVILAFIFVYLFTFMKNSMANMPNSANVKRKTILDLGIWFLSESSFVSPSRSAYLETSKELILDCLK